MNKLVLVVLLAILAGGGWYVYTNNSAEVSTDTSNEEAADMGTYAYRCDTGVEFSMSPNADVSAIGLTPGANATFSATTLASVESAAGARFEGGGMIFVGAGEEVQLTVGGKTLICNPVPSTDMAPWNWGDAGEGAGSVQPDVRLVVGESVMGKWQSTEDAKFIREFKAFSETSMSGTVTDWYDGKQVSSGTYVTFDSKNKLTVPFPVMADKVYLQLTMQGTQAEKLNFSVNKLTPEALELTYMDRGGVLTFKAVK